MDRIKLHQLMTLLNQRQGITFMDVLRSMQAQGIDISDDDFKRRYLKRSRLTRSTVLDPNEITAIIISYIRTPEGTNLEYCTAFEALLICVWSGTGVPVLKRIQHIYGVPAMERAMRYYYEIDDETFDYFDTEQREAIMRLFVHKLANSTVSSDSPFTEMLSDLSPAPLMPPESELKEPLLWENMVLSDKLLKIKNLIINEGKFDQAEILLDEIYTEAQQTDEHLSDWLQYRGIIKTNQGAFNTADEILNDALALGNKSQQARIFANLGANARSKGNHEQAIDYLERGLSVTEEPIVRVYIGTTLGTIYHTEGDRINTRKQYLEALEQAKQAKLMERQVYLLHNIATLDYDEGNYLSASENTQQALRIIGSTSRIQPDLILRIRFNRARVNASLGNYISALEQLHQVYREADAFKFFHFRNYVASEIARLHQCYGHHEVALQLYQHEAHTLFASDESSHELLFRSIYGVVLCTIQRAFTRTMTKILIDCKHNLSDLQITWLQSQPTIEPMLSQTHSDFLNGFGERIEPESHQLTVKVIEYLCKL